MVVYQRADIKKDGENNHKLASVYKDSTPQIVRNELSGVIRNSFSIIIHNKYTN